jgi:hypothetical protein
MPLKYNSLKLKLTVVLSFFIGLLIDCLTLNPGFTNCMNYLFKLRVMGVGSEVVCTLYFQVAMGQN